MYQLDYIVQSAWTHRAIWFFKLQVFASLILNTVGWHNLHFSVTSLAVQNTMVLITHIQHSPRAWSAPSQKQLTDSALWKMWPLNGGLRAACKLGLDHGIYHTGHSQTGAIENNGLTAARSFIDHKLFHFQVKTKWGRRTIAPDKERPQRERLQTSECVFELWNLSHHIQMLSPFHVCE